MVLTVPLGAIDSMAASTGCTRNAVGSSTWPRTLITDVHSARELNAPWMADQGGKFVGPDQLEVVASFCYLGDMLSAAGGCELNHNTCERISRSCYRFSLTDTSFSRHVAACTALVCRAQSSMPVRLGHWQSQTPNTSAKWQGNDQTDLQCQAASSALKIWTSFWRREGSAGMDMWNAPMVQSRQPLTYRLMESMGLGGPRWHGSSWQRGIAGTGSSRLSTLMIDIPGDLVWDLPRVQQASYLEGGPPMWMLPLYLHINQKSDDDDVSD